MSVRRISTGSPFEAALGYSRAVVAGPWCFVSGVTGYDYATMTLPEDVAAQAAACCDTIERVLAEAGFAMADVVRVQYTIVSRDDVERIAPVLARVFGEVGPAATMVVAGLIRPEMKIEVEVTALKA